MKDIETGRSCPHYIIGWSVTLEPFLRKNGDAPNRASSFIVATHLHPWTSTMNIRCQIQIAGIGHFLSCLSVEDRWYFDRWWRTLVSQDAVANVCCDFAFMTSWPLHQGPKTGCDMASEHLSIAYAYFTMLAVKRDLMFQPSRTPA